jgi:hypothetical protein
MFGIGKLLVLAYMFIVDKNSFGVEVILAWKHGLEGDKRTQHTRRTSGWGSKSLTGIFRPNFCTILQSLSRELFSMVFGMGRIQEVLQITS